MSLLETQTPKERRIYLTYPQDKFIFCKDEFVCIKGTFGCGKSLATLIATNLECEQYPNNLYILIRKEYIDLKNSTMRDWENEFGDRYPIVNNQVKYPNKSTLIFLHGDDLNSIKNITAGGASMIQAEEMTEDDFWFLKGRLRRKDGTRQLRLECNYDGHNWIYRLFNERKIGTLITTNTFDNEKNLPPDYIPGLKKLPKKLQDRYLYGTDADMEGVVFEEFSRGRNVIDPFYIPKEWKKIIVLDHGFTNPTAVIWTAIDWDGTLFIYDEHYEKGKIVSYHAEQIKKRNDEGLIKSLIDPSCKAKTQNKDNRITSIIDEYKDYGLFFEPANHDQLGGINRANEFFKTGRLKIFKNCVNTIREVENWKWKTIRPGAIRNQPEQPIDKDNHTCDCIIYLMNDRTKATELQKEKTINPYSAWGKYLRKQKQKEVFIYG